MLTRIRKNFNHWLEGIRLPDKDAAITFVLMFQALKIGQLKIKNGVWEFQYSEEFRNQTELKPLTDFPDLEKIYEAEELWPFFSQRIPSLQQPTVKEFMHNEHLKEVDEVTLLKRFGKRTVANPFELIAVPA